MKDLRELEEYIEKTEDMQLAMMVEIVKEYGNDIPSIIKNIKEKHVGDDEKDKLKLFFPLFIGVKEWSMMRYSL
jgi:hypothetical protein